MPYIGKSPTGSGVRQRFHFTATGGETSLSGADDNSKTLKFTDGEFLDVYLNGVLLVQGTDYGVGTTNTISSLSALSAGDIVEIIAYDIFNVAKINSEAIRARHYFTASGSETSIGTSQIAGLSFAANADIDVSLNGVTLVAGTDYNTTTANTVGGLTALTAGQVVEIVIYEKFQLADALSKAAGGNIGGALGVGTIKEATGTTTAMTIDSGGVVAEPNKEYFQVEVTTLIDGLTDATTVVVDFATDGTVKYDTKSNWDSANNAYLLDSSDGVYLVNFAIVLRSNDLATEQIIDAAAMIEAATDGSTFSGITGSGVRGQDSADGRVGSVSFAGSFVYKSTTSTTKLRMKARVNAASSGNWEIASNANEAQGSSDSAFDSARCSYFNVARIA